MESVPLRSIHDLKVYEPALTEIEIVLVDEEVLLKAQSMIVSCESCADDADITLDYLLDEITGCEPTRTEYLLHRPARCPYCFHAVTEKTLIVASF